MNKSNQKKFNICAVVMFLISVILIYKGYDKITNYSNSDKLTSLNKNAYVGGDAYNYIINGNYANGFFILAGIFVILGVGLIIIGYLSSINNSNIEINEALNRSSRYNYITERILSEDYGQDLDKKVTERLAELKEYTIDSVNVVDSKNYGNKYEAYIIYH